MAFAPMPRDVRRPGPELLWLSLTNDLVCVAVVVRDELAQALPVRASYVRRLALSVALAPRPRDV